MKKLLSLLTAVTLVGTSASSVVACQSQKNDQTEVNRLKNEIINTVLVLPAGTNKDTSNTKTIDAIRAQINTMNPKTKFSAPELKEITFSKVTLPTTQPTKPNVDATITVGKAKATVNLTVSIALTDQEQVDAIANKIINKVLVLPAGTNKDTSKIDTIKAIRDQINSNNPKAKFKDSELKEITFSKVTLPTTQPTKPNVDATITVGQATATVKLTVSIALTDQEKVDAIANKITNKNITIRINSNTSTKDPNTIKALRSGLQKENSTLTSDDLAQITFADITLTAIPQDLIATITKNAATATITLTASINHFTPLIISGLTNPNIYVSPVSIGDKYYLSTVGNGMGLSKDKGKTWRQVGSGISSSEKIYCPPVKLNNKYYLGTYSSGLLTSTNGITWTKINNNDLKTAKIELAPVKIDNIYYLATYGKGLYTSSDQGTSWSQNASTGAGSLDIKSFNISDNGLSFLTTENSGVWWSSDKTTWTQGTGDIKTKDVNAAPVKLDDIYYVGTVNKSTPTTGEGLYTSTDGKNWAQMNLPLVLKTQGIFQPPVVINGNYYLSTYGQGLWTSSDKGITWTQNSTLISTAKIKINPFKVNGIWYIGTIGDGLWASKDAVNWTKNATPGLANAQINSPPNQIDDIYYFSIWNSGLWTIKSL